MKTTLDLSDPLFDQAKDVARRERTSLRALVEEGLRHVLARRAAPASNYALPDRSVGGDGLAPGLEWSQLTALATDIPALEHLHSISSPAPPGIAQGSASYRVKAQTRRKTAT